MENLDRILIRSGWTDTFAGSLMGVVCFVLPDVGSY